MICRPSRRCGYPCACPRRTGTPPDGIQVVEYDGQSVGALGIRCPPARPPPQRRLHRLCLRRRRPPVVLAAHPNPRRQLRDFPGCGPRKVRPSGRAGAFNPATPKPRPPAGAMENDRQANEPTYELKNEQAVTAALETHARRIHGCAEEETGGAWLKRREPEKWHHYHGIGLFNRGVLGMGHCRAISSSIAIRPSQWNKRASQTSWRRRGELIRMIGTAHHRAAGDVNKTHVPGHIAVRRKLLRRDVINPPVDVSSVGCNIVRA